MIDGADNVNRPLTAPESYKQCMLDAGFVDLHKARYRWPMDMWPKDPHYKELGLWTVANVLEGVDRSG